MAASIGDKAALKVYKKLLDYTRETIVEASAKKYLYYHESVVKDDWSTSQFHKQVQRGETLGQRMTNAFTEVFRNVQSAIIIGSDCPELEVSIINEAFEALQNNDVVIGPSTDGGYYLLGMRKCQTALFDNIPWSTSSVLEETLKKCDDLSLEVHTLTTLHDIDTIEDLKLFPAFNP